jgi:hypothetical protein
MTTFYEYIIVVNTHTLYYYSDVAKGGETMKSTVKRKGVQKMLGKKTEPDTLDLSPKISLFRKNLLKSLEKVSGKGGVRRG